MMILGILAVCFCCFFTSSHGHMNVLFLVADDMRPQFESLRNSGNYPVPTSDPQKMHTPNLDALAARSLVLERSYVQQALCSPSRTSILTGRRPDTTRVYKIGPYFRNVGGNFTTLPQFFKNNGYATIGMGKVFHQGAASGDDDPISWTQCEERNPPCWCFPYYRGDFYFESHTKSWEAIPEEKLKGTMQLVDRQLADKAIATMRCLKDDDNKPFFMAVGFHKPHLPFVFPSKFLDKYQDVQLPENPFVPENLPEVAWYSNGGLLSYKDIHTMNFDRGFNKTFPDSLTLDLRKAYLASLSWTDSLIGELLAELKNLGLDKNTIVSFFGDHGYSLGENGEWTKFTNFNLATHAPMMIHIPGKTDEGINIKQITEHVDLFPTLVEATGFDPLELCPEDGSNDVALCSEGKSLLPLISKPDEPIKNAVFSQFLRGTDVMGYSMTTDRYRYTAWTKFNANTNKALWNKKDAVELYDHQIDPFENVNRADFDDYADIKQTLHDALIQGWRKA